MVPVLVEISLGELLDKLTILQIKSERIADEAKLRNVRQEMEALTAARARATPQPPAELERLVTELRTVNEALWDVEDALRRAEAARDFGPHFIELARSVYRHNDRRAALKRQINELLGSRLVEEKSYG
jgi:hypothetical protein